MMPRADPAPDAGDPARAQVPEDGQEAEAGQEEQAGPLGADGEAQADARSQPPPADAQPGAGQQLAARTACRRRRRPPAGRAGAASRRRPSSRSISSAPNAARTQNIRKMSSSEVRDMTRWWPSTASSSPAAAPRVSERNSFWAIRASRSDGQRAGQRRGEPPAERVVRPEQPHAGRDHPFAHGRVDHVFGGVQQNAGVAGDESVVGLVRPAPLVAADQQRVAVLDVVRLVKHEAPGDVQPDEPQDAAHRGGEGRNQPEP